MKNIFTLVIVFCCCFTVNAQIPNAGFEVWDSSAGYKVPVGWDNMNANTASSSVFTCSPATPGFNGDYYLDLTTKNISGMGVVPAIAVSGKLDPVTHRPATGFPYTGRPKFLTGVYEYMAYSSTDQGYIAMLLTKWNTGTNSRDTIAHSFYALPGMYMVWTRFFIPMTYFSSATPDSAMIILAASGASFTAVDASYLWTDNLAFVDSSALETANIGTTSSRVNIVPNPAHDQAYVSFSCYHSGRVTIAVMDISGRIVKSQISEANNGNDSIPIDISNLSAGQYFIKVIEDEGTQVGKLAVE